MKRTILLLILVGAILSTSTVFATDRLVPSEYATIQAAIDAAVNGDSVIIAQGTYTGADNRELDFGGKAITVQSTNPNNWDVVAATIIDCQYGGRGFHFHSGETASSVLAGLTITNGYADFGGGIFCTGSSPTIRNCIFSDNIADYGGGMGNQNCSPTVTECMFVGNSVFYYGGGMYNFGCTLAVSNCIFAGNSADWGGGMENFDCSGAIVNCTFTGNSADMGGGMDNSSSSGLAVSNCILWGDSAGTGPEIYGTVSVSYSDVQGGSTGTGNINADPCFADAAGGDYHLLPGSACIDAGTNSPAGGLPEADIEGIPRPLDGDADGTAVADMGVYEFYFSEPLIALSATYFEFTAVLGEPNPPDQVLSVSNPGAGTLNWTISEGCGWFSAEPTSGSSLGEANEITLSVDISGLAAGSYYCELTISDPCAVNNPRTVDVNLSVGLPIIELSATQFEFMGGVNGPNPPDQTLTIRNSGLGTLNWTITYDCNWLSVEPTSGSSRGEVNEVTLSVDVSGLVAGNYNCELTVTDSNAENSPQTVSVNLIVQVPAMIELSSQQFEFIVAEGGANPNDQVLSIRNSGGGRLDWQITEVCSWLSAEPNSGSSMGEVNEVILSVDITGLAAGSYNCELTVSDANAGNSPQVVSIYLVISQLISHWEFEEGEGTTAHDSVGSNDGTIYGAGWTAGMIGGALSFDGMDDYVDLGNDSSLKPPLPVTLCAWVNLSSLGSLQYIMALDAQTSGYCGIWWYVGAAGDLAINYGDGASPAPRNRRSKVGTTELATDTWYHIAAVVRGPGDMSLYINGIDDGGTYSGSGGSLRYSGATSLVGMKHDSQYALGGKIDDVRVYDGALYRGEILEIYLKESGQIGIDAFPETVEFYADEGGPNPASQAVLIRRVGVGELNWRITENCSWLEVDPNAGTSTGEADEVIVSVDISGLTWGWYDCNVVVSDPCAYNDPALVEVTLGVRFAGAVLVPSECPTIQAAIDLAADGATVIVEPGTYTGPGNKDLDFGGKAITVRSVEPEDPCVVAATIIDCEYSGRGFYFHSGEGPDSVIEGLTITKAGNRDGGGIYCGSSSPTILNCMVIGNHSSEGGGIFVQGGGPTIVNCIISNNRAVTHGGAICNGLSSGTRLINCIIVGNLAGSPENGIGNGGAIFCWSSSDVMSISGCTFTNNSLRSGYYPEEGCGHGGAIFCTEGSTITISNCIFWGDWAPKAGSEIYGSASVSYSDVEGGYSGVGNINADPCFVSGPLGEYYLSQIAAGQEVNSPCVDAGSDTAGNLGMDIYTTRTDGVNDVGIVDMGYHYPMTVPNPADLDGDWDVDFFDYGLFAAGWDITNSMTIPRGTVVVDGNLSEWSTGVEWVALDKIYYGSPNDVDEAWFALRWDADANKVYAAVIAYDSDHVFLDEYVYWDASDRLEVYSQGDAEGGSGWVGTYDVAQQYYVAPNSTDGCWATWAFGETIGGDAGFECAVTVSGDEIIYEIGVTQFDNYGGFGGGDTIVTDINVGSVVGFDLVLDTRWSDGFGMLSENLMTGKSGNADQFARYMLVEEPGGPPCFERVADLDGNCVINFNDLAILVENWLWGK